MQKSSLKLTVCFDKNFWIGVLERQEEGFLKVCKVTFGAEPRDSEVYVWLLKNLDNLSFGSPLETDNITERRMNPKRLQRMVKRQTAQAGIGTKAQQALKKQMEAKKVINKSNRKRRREIEEDLKFKQKQLKKKEKKRGH